MPDEPGRIASGPSENSSIGADAANGESLSLETLPWTVVGRILARDSRLIFPVGALEQHGPHLPLGTNAFMVSRLAHELSRRHSVLTAPTLHYGVSVPGQRYAGTATLKRKTLNRAMTELLTSWEEHGVTEVIVLTAQRYEPHLDALLMAMMVESKMTVVDVYSIEVHDLIDGSSTTEHAGEVETSIMLHLAPELVLRDRLSDAPPDEATVRRYGARGMPTPPAGSLGVVGRPSLATAEKGERIWSRYLDVAGSALKLG